MFFVCQFYYKIIYIVYVVCWIILGSMWYIILSAWRIIELIYVDFQFLHWFHEELFCDKAWLSCKKELESDPFNSDTLDFWINCENFLRLARSNTIEYQAPIDMNSKNVELQEKNELKRIYTSKKQDRILRLCCINYVFSQMALWKDDNLDDKTNALIFNTANDEKQREFSLFHARDRKFTKFIKQESRTLYKNINNLSDLQKNSDNSEIKNGRIASITTVVAVLQHTIQGSENYKLQQYQLLKQKERGELNTTCMRTCNAWTWLNVQVLVCCVLCLLN